MSSELSVGNIGVCPAVKSDAFDQRRWDSRIAANVQALCPKMSISTSGTAKTLPSQPAKGKRQEKRSAAIDLPTARSADRPTQKTNVWQAACDRNRVCPCLDSDLTVRTTVEFDLAYSASHGVKF